MVAEFNQMKEKNHVFHPDVLLLLNVFAVLNKKIFLMLKDLTVRWLIEIQSSYRGKEPLLVIEDDVESYIQETESRMRWLAGSCNLGL